MKVITDKIVPVFVNDFSSMIGKMADFKAIMKKNGIEDDDSLCDNYGEFLSCQIGASIECDGENISMEDSYIQEILGRENLMIGFQEINGFPILGINLGGDWENPIYAVFVSDGTDALLYVPKKGNCFNPKYNSAFGNNNDVEEAEDVACDMDMIVEDICVAFNIPSTKTIPVSENGSSLSEIEDSFDELVDAVEALSSEETANFLKENLTDALDKFKEILSSVQTESSKTETVLKGANAKLEKEVDSLKDDKKHLEKMYDSTKKELDGYKSGSISTSSAKDTAFDEIAKIIAAVSGGAPIPSASVPSATPVAPVPAKPLKKISLPTKTIKFEYVYGVEMDGSTAILHIIKKEDWDRDELAKEGRVDVDTVSRLKAVVPLKRDKFVYILDNNYSTVQEVVDEVSKVAGINLEHSKDVQAKF